VRGRLGCAGPLKNEFKYLGDKSAKKNIVYSTLIAACVFYVLISSRYVLNVKKREFKVLTDE